MVAGVVVSPGGGGLRTCRPPAAARHVDTALSAGEQVLAGGNRLPAARHRRHRQYAHDRAQRLARLPRRRERHGHHGRTAAHGFTAVRPLRHVHDLVRIDYNKFGPYISFR